ncbi:MAG: GDSL family lipase [Planctomycetaceae bacterium]|nr:GDSL family lipase [Planctomycetaceae bacterium]
MFRCNRSLVPWFAVTTLIALASAAAISVAQDKASDAVTPVPRDGNWMKRHESFNERVKKGNVDLLLIGDSITQGWETAGKAVWEKYYTPRNAVNLGIGGDRTQHVLWRLDNGNIEGLSPKAAVLMIGTNNSGMNSSVQIAEGVEAIVKKLRAKLPKTKILVLAIFPRGATIDDARRKVNIGANRSIAKLADGEMVHFLDIGDKFLNDDGTLSKEVMPDLLHLNEKSYTTWAAAIEPKLKELMGEK